MTTPKWRNSVALLWTVLLLSCAEVNSQLRPHSSRRSYVHPKIFEPINEGSIDVLFVFGCGGLIEAPRYISLLEKIRTATTELRLWITMVEKTVEVTPELMDTAIDDSLIKVWELGFRLNSSLVFIGGHSLGAVIAGEMAYERTDVRGLLHIGSTFFKRDNLLQYPKPVLILVGGRDGRVGYQSVARDAVQIYNAEPDFTQENTYYVKPVIILPGVNHAQGYDGLDPNISTGDLVADISVEQAHADIARVVAAFLTVRSLGHHKKARKSAEVLKAGVVAHREKYVTYGKALAQEGSGAEEMQVRLAAESSLAVDKVTVVHHEWMHNFIASRPCNLGGRSIIHLHLQQVDPYDQMHNVWIKFRSRAAVLNDSCGSRGIHTDAGGGAIASAREFNERRFMEALALVTEEGRARYWREGKLLRFVDDLALDESTSWDASDVTLRPSTDEPNKWFECQSPVFRSDSVYYMKVISAARAMIWIYQDAYRIKQRY